MARVPRRRPTWQREVDTIDPHSVAFVLKRAAAAAALPTAEISGHSLRARFVTEAKKHGADDAAIMDQAGHKSIEMVHRYHRRAKSGRSPPARSWACERSCRSKRCEENGRTQISAVRARDPRAAAAQQHSGWGAGIVGKLAAGLAASFPSTKSFWRATLTDMRASPAAWPDNDLVQQPVGHLLVGHDLRSRPGPRIAPRRKTSWR